MSASESGRRKVLDYFETHKEFMEGKIERGIAENRKGLASVKIIDREGNAVNGTKLTVRQTSHDFKFGCSSFLFDGLTDTDTVKYGEALKKICNQTIVPFYWSDLEPERGKPRYSADSPKRYRRPAPDIVVDFCRKNNIRMKGHCLMYHSFMPGWMPYEVGNVKEITDGHFKEIAERYADKIEDWDVINETLCGMPENFRFGKEDDYIDWSFECARRYFKDNTLLINEASFIWSAYQWNRSGYYMLIENLLSRGVKIDAIGMQYHMFFKREDEIKSAPAYYNPVRLYDVMDTYGKFGLPLHVSEITVPAYSCESEDEEIQAEVTRNLYRIWFSHPNMEAIIWWNMVDGYTYAPSAGWNENIFAGGLLRHDFTEKPAFKAIDNLVNSEWRTDLTLDAAGNTAEFIGFYGDYDITAEKNGHVTNKKIHFGKHSNSNFTITI